jgi:hypothetical protein
MKKTLLLIGLLLMGVSAWAKQAASGWCQTGNVQVMTQGLASTNPVMGSYPLCLVSVYVHGTTTLATIYSDNLTPATSLSNPFTANTDGSFILYAANGRYDVVISNGVLTNPLLPAPKTTADVLLCDPQDSAGGSFGCGATILPTTAPVCSSSTAGLLNYTQGAAGVKDTVQVCAKDATNTWAWRTIY